MIDPNVLMIGIARLFELGRAVMRVVGDEVLAYLMCMRVRVRQNRGRIGDPEDKPEDNGGVTPSPQLTHGAKGNGRRAARVVPESPLIRNRLLHRNACLGAPPTGFRTDSAMLHMARMRAALFRAAFTSLGTGVQLCTQRIRIPMSGPHQQLARYVTDVRAIQIQPDAQPQLCDTVFGQAGIGANGARFRALETCFNARQRLGPVSRGRLRMRGHHFT